MEDNTEEEIEQRDVCQKELLLTFVNIGKVLTLNHCEKRIVQFVQPSVAGFLRVLRFPRVVSGVAVGRLGGSHPLSEL